MALVFKINIHYFILYFALFYNKALLGLQRNERKVQKVPLYLHTPIVSLMSCISVIPCYS